MLFHSATSSQTFKSLVRNGSIVLAGNRPLKIFGSLHCATGRRMKVRNRVFFASEEEALRLGYRPCGHCMRAAYAQWKQQTKQ